ncbi:hypothetical protein GCM10027091_30490 [Streptomyces daliensis]
MRAASTLSGWLCSTTASAAASRSETSQAVTTPNSTISAASTAPMARSRPGSVVAAARTLCTPSVQALRRLPWGTTGAEAEAGADAGVGAGAGAAAEAGAEAADGSGKAEGEEAGGVTGGGDGGRAPGGCVTSRPPPWSLTGPRAPRRTVGGGHGVHGKQYGRSG